MTPESKHDKKEQKREISIELAKPEDAEAIHGLKQKSWIKTYPNQQYCFMKVLDLKLLVFRIQTNSLK